MKSTRPARLARLELLMLLEDLQTIRARILKVSDKIERTSHAAGRTLPVQAKLFALVDLVNGVEETGYSFLTQTSPTAAKAAQSAIADAINGEVQARGKA